MENSKSGGTVSRAIKSYFTEFGRLRDCPRDFWVVQLVNLLDGVAYFSMLTVATLYLSETLGYSDTDAGLLWGTCMLVYTLMAFVAGFIGDSLGIKRTLHLSVILLVASRLAISATTNKSVVIPALFVIAIGTAIMTPILIAATKRFTTKKSQTAGFNLLYLFMNVGAFLGNYFFDPLRESQWGNRAIFMMGSAMSILCWISILFFMRKRISHADQAKQSQDGGDGSAQPAEDKKWEAPWTIAISVFRESAFWRFMLFLLVLIGVRLVFEYQYQIYPKYYLRTMSEPLLDTDLRFVPSLNDQIISDELRALMRIQGTPLNESATVTVENAGTLWRIKDVKNRFTVRRTDDALKIYVANVPLGKLNSINPFIICFGVILSTPIVARFRLFNVMFVGIVISALSMFVLAIYPGWFCGALGMTLRQGYATIIIIQIAIFSIGEAIWSPRLYEYTAAIAPEGREASYMGLSYLPQSAARFGAGPLAGFLLGKYCPPDITENLATVPYHQSPQFMCLILAVIALATPILIVVFRGVIQKEATGKM